jgi:putative tryptophan/tyrosine transport system substrate-binding protein
MSGKIFFWLLTTVLLAIDSGAYAQQTKKLPRIGYLTGSSAAAMSSRTGAFQQGLRDLGYVEGQNIVVEYRFADGKTDRVPALAAELVRLNVELIVVGGGNALLKATTQSIGSLPVVMANVQDPVGSGFIASLAHPGGTITGLSSVTSELAGKRLDLIRETFPKIVQVAALYDPQDESKLVEMSVAQAVAKLAGLKLQEVEARAPAAVESAFNTAMKARAEVLLVMQSAVTVTARKPIADLAIKNRLPTIWADSILMDAGGLMSYGPNTADLFRRAAAYVDKILKGAKPADLPVEQPKTFEFVINLKTAKQIGVTIPQWTLMKADRVIK